MRIDGQLTFVTVLLAGVGANALMMDPETFTYDALGRLIETQGGSAAANNDEVISLCYDQAGNRTSLISNSTGASNHCDTGTPTSTPNPSPSPSPTPTPTPTNSPPVTSPDAIAGQCGYTVSIDLLANDSDPDMPLSLVSISKLSGQAITTISSTTEVDVSFGPQFDISDFEYVVQDALGAQSTGELNVSTSSCGGGAGGS